MPEFEKHFTKFVNQLHKKMEDGAATYGDESFAKDPAHLVNEVQQELVDVCGWGLILWVRLEKMKEKLRRV